MPLKSCLFVFDNTPPFPGFAYGSTWKGFDNVAVTPEVRDQIIAHFQQLGDDCSDMLELPVVNGLVCLGWGYPISIV